MATEIAGRWVRRREKGIAHDETEIEYLVTSNSRSEAIWAAERHDPGEVHQTAITTREPGVFSVRVTRVIYW